MKSIEELVNFLNFLPIQLDYLVPLPVGHFTLIDLLNLVLVHYIMVPRALLRRRPSSLILGHLLCEFCLLLLTRDRLRN